MYNTSYRKENNFLRGCFLCLIVIYVNGSFNFALKDYVSNDLKKEKFRRDFDWLFPSHKYPEGNVLMLNRILDGESNLPTNHCLPAKYLGDVNRLTRTHFSIGISPIQTRDVWQVRQLRQDLNIVELESHLPPFLCGQLTSQEIQEKGNGGYLEIWLTAVASSTTVNSKATLILWGGSKSTKSHVLFGFDIFPMVGRLDFIAKTFPPTDSGLMFDWRDSLHEETYCEFFGSTRGNAEECQGGITNSYTNMKLGLLVLDDSPNEICVKFYVNGVNVKGLRRCINSTYLNFEEINNWKMEVKFFVGDQYVHPRSTSVVDIVHVQRIFWLENATEYPDEDSFCRVCEQKVNYDYLAKSIVIYVLGFVILPALTFVNLWKRPRRNRFPLCSVTVDFVCEILCPWLFYLVFSFILQPFVSPLLDLIFNLTEYPVSVFLSLVMLFFYENVWFPSSARKEIELLMRLVICGFLSFLAVLAFKFQAPFNYVAEWIIDLPFSNIFEEKPEGFQSFIVYFVYNFFVSGIFIVLLPVFILSRCSFKTRRIKKKKFPWFWNHSVMLFWICLSNICSSLVGWRGHHAIFLIVCMLIYLTKEKQVYGSRKSILSWTFDKVRSFCPEIDIDGWDDTFKKWRHNFKKIFRRDVCERCRIVNRRWKLENFRKCTECERVRYCSEDCQKIDWPRHKNDC